MSQHDDDAASPRPTPPRPADDDPGAAKDAAAVDAAPAQASAPTRPSRRGFLGGGLGAMLMAGAAATSTRAALEPDAASAHPLEPHDTPPRADFPDYGLDGRALKRPVPRMGMVEGDVYEPTPPTDAPTDPDAYWTFDRNIILTRHEFMPGVSAHVLAFNGQVPAPEIRVPEGAWVQVNFRNDTNLLHTIHWHGIMVPENMDGVPFINQPPVMPGQTFIYRFRALPYGTHFYHCHFGTVMHMQAGMHGAFIIEGGDDDPIRQQFPYTRDYTLLLGQFDTQFIDRELREMESAMRERMLLMQRGRLSDRALNRFPTMQDFLAAVDDGYIPPYTLSRSNRRPPPRFNVYTINGKSYPMTEHLKIARDELIRVRLINVGVEEHYMHLHGHDFWEVARDGAPLPHAFRGNTLPVTPGRTHDIIIEGKNPGAWTFHDHATTRATNNGTYPGGILTLLVYEGFEPEHPPAVSLMQ